MEKIIHSIDGICPECKSKNPKRDTPKGEDFYGDCGLVVRECKVSQ